MKNRKIVLVSRPIGWPSLENFRMEEEEIPPLSRGQVLVHHRFLSLDPYMRGRMNDGKGYAPPQPLGQVMLGGTAGEVVASRCAAFSEGDTVVGMGGWQEFSVVDGELPGQLRKVDTGLLPLSAYLGVAGMPGITAWYGVRRILTPRSGTTVVVSTAAGAVGSVAGQLARLAGARVVGIAGSPEKCAYVIKELGFDACINHRAHPDAFSLARALADACPDGIDGDFENVGGIILDAVLLRANPFARIALCGMIAGYNGEPIPLATPQLLLLNRMKLEGFLISEHLDLWPEALAELTQLVASGQLRYRETIAEGLDNAPAAFLGLLRGENFGKQLVRI
ncbi:MAG: NADP-dependent oxidoreductase [Myxococcales bacterium]|nr:NADP-dependent oxidoreductase [Polyangiaceae bacterium]MDW8252131.1 NADP-dependent oxidoreductase [Myxococcales bacterium]